MHQLQPLLEKIGLNHHESAVYLQLLQFGESAASQIAKKLNVPRSTVRGSLDKLTERGIVSKLFKRETQYYRCKPPQTLVALLEARVAQSHAVIEEIRTSMPLFDALYNSSEVVPKVQFYEGLEQVIEAFNRTLQIEELTEILVITSYKFLSHPLLKKNDEEVYIPVRLRKKIQLKIVAGHNDLPEKRFRNEPDMMRERRYLPSSYSFPGTFYICGDTVLYFSASNDEYIAVNIESRLMAETMRVLHTFMWNSLEVSPPEIVHLEKLAGAHSSAVELVAIDDKKYVLKTALPEEVANERAFQKVCCKKGIPTLKEYSFPELPSNQILLEYIQDSPVLGDRLTTELALSWGSATRKMHDITYGTPMVLTEESEMRPISWSTFIDEAIAYAKQRVVRKNADLSFLDMQKLEEQLLCLRENTPPRYALLHGDLHANNVLVAGEKLLFFDKASDIFAGDPLYDIGIVKLGFVEKYAGTDDANELEMFDAFVRGYGALTTEEMQRIDLYMLLQAFMRYPNPFQENLPKVLEQNW